MEWLIWTLIARSALALLLAAGGAVSARWSARPGLTYALCTLAIAALLAPPLVQVAVIPPPTMPTIALPHADAEARSTATMTVAPRPVTRSTGSVTSTGMLFAIWGCGSIALLLLAALRLRRFSRALVDRRPAPGEIRRATKRLADRLGIRRVPPVYLTASAITPLLRPRGGRLEILFPSELLERLTDDERDTLLAHELSHVRRRDHWMRWLEFAGATLFWWHPAIWWARRRLRRAEEQLCDRSVLDHFPQLRAAYARGLFKTAEYLADSGRRLPALACGAGEARFLKERLMMIVEPGKSRTLSRAQRVLLTLLAIGLLIVVPTWAEHGTDVESERRTGRADANERLIELEQRAQQLERQLEELRVQQRMLEGELRVRRGGDAADEGTREEVVRSERLLREAQLQRDVERSEIEARAFELAARESELERRSALSELTLDAERAAAEGDEALARELQIELDELQIQVEHELGRRGIEFDRRRMESEMRRHELSRGLESEEQARLDALRARAHMQFERERSHGMPALADEAGAGGDAEVDRLREEIEALKLQLEQAHRGER